tara:strand:+ start:325 stop:546 length:222 start_codon:yes stop_codon:yes gene_type:complete
MFGDSQLEVLHGIMTRRVDTNVSSQDYEDLLHMIQTEQAVRRSARQKQRDHRARVSATEAPVLPELGNDPIKW